MQASTQAICLIYGILMPVFDAGVTFQRLAYAMPVCQASCMAFRNLDRILSSVFT